MTLSDLGILYAAGGAISLAWAHRSVPSSRAARARERLGSAVLTFFVWPLWLPVLLGSSRAAAPAPSGSPSETERALLEARRAVEGTPLDPLLPASALEKMQAELRRASERCAELERVLADPSFDRGAAAERLARLERDGGSARALLSARSHLENIERLHGLHRRDRGALEELGGLARALRTQLVLARYSGSSPDEVGDILVEVWARLEVLDTAFEPPLRHGFDERSEARLGGG